MQKSLHSFFEPDVLTATDYYPFGMEMPGRKYNPQGYRYGFNGKENDRSGEWGLGLVQDYGFRLYNPRLGRFLSVDPLTTGYPWYTPYQFAGNTPIAAIDLDGAEPTKVLISIGKKVTKAVLNLLHAEQVDRLKKYTTVKTPQGLKTRTTTLSRRMQDELNYAMQPFEDSNAEQLVEWFVAFIPVANDVYAGADFIVENAQVGSRLYYTTQRINILLGAVKNRGNIRDGSNAMSSENAHHLMPIEVLERNQHVQNAVLDGFEINNFQKNGKNLQSGKDGFHGNHPALNDFMDNEVNAFAEEFKSKNGREPLGVEVTRFLETTLLPRVDKIIDKALKIWKTGGEKREENLNSYFNALNAKA